MNVPDINAAVLYLLTTNETVRGLVETNIFFNRLPQSVTSDAITLWSINENALMSLTAAQGLDQATLQIDAYSRESLKANEIAHAVWTELIPFHGDANGVFIKGATRQRGIRHTVDRPKEGTGLYRYIASQDLLFTYDSKTLIEDTP